MTMTIMTNDLSGRKCKGVPDPWGEKEARQSGDEDVDQENDDSDDDDNDDNNDCDGDDNDGDHNDNDGDDDDNDVRNKPRGISKYYSKQGFLEISSK